ncbi:MAG: hypothetical protein AAF725_25470, partial [Acidobacteriota bacterium]
AGLVARRVAAGLALVALLGLTAREGLAASDPSRVSGMLHAPTRAVFEAARSHQLVDPVYSNVDDSLYMATGQRCLRLPQVEHESDRGRRVEGVEGVWAGLKESLEKGGTIVYYSPSRRRYLPTQEEIEARLPVVRAVEAADGVIYQVLPAGPPTPRKAAD